MLAIAALLAGRVFLGVGESFTATGATLWGIKTVGAIHTSRVISWNGVATYVAMAVGARWELPSITILASAALLRW